MNGAVSSNILSQSFQDHFTILLDDNDLSIKKGNNLPENNRK